MEPGTISNCERSIRLCDIRVVVLLVDCCDLRPAGKLHVVVRPLQACIVHFQSTR